MPYCFLKYGYFSAYFVDLKTHEGSQRSWLVKSLLWMPFYSHRLGLPKFNLFSVYKLQLEQLCDFVPLNSWFFISPPPSLFFKQPQLLWWKEWKASAYNDKPAGNLILALGAGWAYQLSSVCRASFGSRCPLVSIAEGGLMLIFEHDVY